MEGGGLSACGGVPPVCWSDHQSDVGNRDEISSAAGFEAFSVRDKGAFLNILKEFFFLRKKDNAFFICIVFFI